MEHSIYRFPIVLTKIPIFFSPCPQDSRAAASLESWLTCTLHNFEKVECIQALREIERVCIRGSFVTVDAYRNEKEKEAMLAWNLTAKTILHVDEWVELFKEAGYTGDYYWFMP